MLRFVMSRFLKTYQLRSLRIEAKVLLENPTSCKSEEDDVSRSIQLFLDYDMQRVERRTEIPIPRTSFQNLSFGAISRGVSAI